MGGNWTKRAKIVAILNLLPPCQTSLGVGRKCERACSALCYGLYSTTNSAGIERVAEEKSSVKNRPLVKNENVCIILYTGIRLPRTALYLIFYVFLIFGTNVINTARPSTPRRSKMPVRGERWDTPSSSIARAATAGYRCRCHRSSGSYSRQSGETARREQRLNRKRE